MSGCDFNLRDRLKEIDQRVMAGLTPFQRATVEHIASIYREGQKRVLVADEVGLGKTLIARGVISKIANLRAEEGDDLVKIAYICSNAAIAAQNIEKLSIDGDVKLNSSETSRLSMQHLALAKERGDRELRRRYIQITPLTPSTSFSISNGMGTQRERALMLAVLSYDKRFGQASNRHKQLSDILWNRYRGSCEVNWDSVRMAAADDVAQARHDDPSKGDHTGYPYDVLARVESELVADGRVTLKDIAAYIDMGYRDNAVERGIILDLRKAFSKACVEMLNPDFVIMDEFQRFHELIADSNTESSLLAKRFLSGSTRVLLLSATPYRMYSTAAESDDGGFGSSYREFLEVMSFLHDESGEKDREFEDVWCSYAASLQRLSIGVCDIVAIKGAKKQAEVSARRSIARTERQSTGELGPITDSLSHVQVLKISSCDIQSYLKLSELASEAGVPRTLFQTDFVKSCPFPLSFMARYRFSKKLLEGVSNCPNLVRASKSCDAGLLWLRRRDIASYQKLKVGNARYAAFMEDFCGKPDVKPEHLLWIPASKPYYRVPKASPFARASGFSKFLLFSAWSMVPPALSTMISYEFERRNVLALNAITGKSYRYFKDGETDTQNESRDEQALPYRRMRFDAEQRSAFLLLYPSPYLAGLIDVPELAKSGKSLIEVRRSIRARIALDLARAFGVKRLPGARRSKTGQSMEWYIMATLMLDKVSEYNVIAELCDDPSPDAPSFKERYKSEYCILHAISDEFASWKPRSFSRCPSDLVDVLADAAIGSPAVCALRCYSSMTNKMHLELAFEFGHAFLNRMNTASSTLAVAAVMEQRDKRSAHWKNMLAYCCEGNLQAVVDEYAHVSKPVSSELSPEEMVFRTHRAMVGEGANPNCHNVETRHLVQMPNAGHAKERIGRANLRTNIASAFLESSSKDMGEDAVSRTRLRNAFNSPFRPFVLVSTSIGQEGLDFHRYCRKVCHWNLPGNPIDLEQREGRVNRFKGLAVRQSVSNRYGDSFSGRGPVWDELFETARHGEFAKEGREETSGLLPYWGVSDGEAISKVERYAYLYPFSRDVARYERLIDDVCRYRAVMGMPNQEELLAKLEDRVAEGDLTEESLEELFMNLCPYVWGKQRDGA